MFLGTLFNSVSVRRNILSHIYSLVFKMAVISSSLCHSCRFALTPEGEINYLLRSMHVVSLITNTVVAACRRGGRGQQEG